MTDDPPGGLAADYSPAVGRLLGYGEPQRGSEWPDYVGEMGLTEADVPDLTRLLTDERIFSAASDSREVWANMHAWRAIGQLRAASAAGALLEAAARCDEVGDDWFLAELPKVFTMIGPAALGALEAYVADTSHSEYARVCAIESMREIAKRHSVVQGRCIEALTKRLDVSSPNGYDANAFLAHALVELGATGAATTIRHAYERGHVDESIFGTWQVIADELGVEAGEPKGANVRPSPPPGPGAPTSPPLPTATGRPGGRAPMAPTRPGGVSDAKARSRARKKRRAARKDRARNRKRKRR